MYNGKIYATHSDLTDKDQSITYEKKGKTTKNVKTGNVLTFLPVVFMILIACIAFIGAALLWRRKVIK